jgi:transglutaminase-like putative cysteine protease
LLQHGLGCLNKGGGLMQQFNVRSLTLLLMLVLVLTAPVAGSADFTTSNRALYEIRQQVRLTRQGGPVENLQVEVPVFLTEKLPPYQRLIAFRTNLPSVKIISSETEPLAVYQLSQWRGSQAILLELDYTIENRAIDYHLSKYSGRNIVASRYLLPEPAIESAAGAIVTVANTLCAQEAYPLHKAMKIFDYVNSRVRYQRNEGAKHSALQTLRSGVGNCEDFALLYIALCRAAGLPARFVNGFRFDSENLKKGIYDLEQFGHAWVEVNLPGNGWVPVEPTYTYMVNGAKRVNHQFFGKLSADDRHLLFNYSRTGSPRCSWNRDRRARSRVKLEAGMTIRCVK